MNFLEQLAAEWYATQGFFVRTKVKANRRVNGDWSNELGVLAFNPANEELVHLETSWDTLTWKAREARFVTRRFVFSDGEYQQLVGHRPSKIRKRAVIGTSQSSPKLSWGADIEVVTVPEFMAEICSGIKDKHPLRDVIPETYPRLRAVQFTLAYASRD